MDSEEARFLLSACRPNGADANDPRIAEALEQARRDPELARWLAEEQAFDAAVVRKLHRKEPPANLRARLLAGTRASRKSRARPHPAWWLGAAAAAVVLAAGSALWWRGLRDTPPPAEIAARPALREWQQSCLAIFSEPNFALDLMNGDYPPVEKYLVDHGTRVLPALPFKPGAVGLVGCKVLAWHGQAVSFTCLKAATGELVHLFVVPRGTADEALLAAGPHHEPLADFATVSWRHGDLVAMVASKMPAAQLDGIIARAVAVAPGSTRPLAGDFAVR